MHGLIMVALLVTAAVCGLAAETAMAPAGKPIQPALDAVAGTGGTVLLGAGVHTITETLQVSSETTLAGQGPATVLQSDPTTRPQIIGTLVPDVPGEPSVVLAGVWDGHTRLPCGSALGPTGPGGTSGR